MGLERIVQMLKTSKEFDFVYKNSYKFRSESLDICVLKPNLAGQFYEKFRKIPCSLVGFSVSKKVGNAVERNLIKRRLRAICREFFNVGNSVLGMQFRTCKNFQASTDSSLVESPKIFTNTKATPQSLPLRFCESQNLGENSAKSAESTPDSAISQNLVKNNSVRSTQTRPLRGAKNRIQGCSSGKADFLLEADKRGTLPKSEKRQLLGTHFKRVGESGERGVALLREEKDSKENAESTQESQSRLQETSHSLVLPRRFCESARNDNMVQNLICIFIAKSQILQTPFATLKSTIFTTLKRQLNFRQGSYKKPRTSSPHNAQNRKYQNHTKGTL